MNEKSRNKISSIRQEIYLLQKQRNNLIWKMLGSLRFSMIPATFSLVYRRCGKKNCKCNRGERHGPYPAIQIKINNKMTVKMVKKDDANEVKKKTERYRKYQEGLARINRLNRQINKLLQEARDKNLEVYE